LNFQKGNGTYGMYGQLYRFHQKEKGKTSTTFDAHPMHLMEEDFYIL